MTRTGQGTANEIQRSAASSSPVGLRLSEHVIIRHLPVRTAPLILTMQQPRKQGSLHFRSQISPLRTKVRAANIFVPKLYKSTTRTLGPRHPLRNQLKVPISIDPYQDPYSNA